MLPEQGSVRDSMCRDGVLVDDEEVVKIKDNKLQTSEPGSMLINPLKSALDKKVKKVKDFNSRLKKGGAQDLITIIIHGGTHFDLVSKVMYTAGQATFKKFKFAVIKGGMLNTRI